MKKLESVLKLKSMNCNKFIVAAVTLAFLSSCADNSKRLPQNPRDGEVYVDNNGSSWVWNALLMRWALSGGGNNGTYYYYPSTGNYTNSSGVKVDPPKQNNISSPKRPSSTHKSFTNKSSNSRKSVFGGTGRSKSISA